MAKDGKKKPGSYSGKDAPIVRVGQTEGKKYGQDPHKKAKG